MLEKEAREILSAFALVPGAEIDNRRIKAIHVLLTQVETKSDFIDNLYKTEKKSVMRIAELEQQLQARTDEVNTLTRRLAELNVVVQDRNEQYAALEQEINREKQKNALTEKMNTHQPEHLDLGFGNLNPTYTVGAGQIVFPPETVRLEVAGMKHVAEVLGRHEQRIVALEKFIADDTQIVKATNFPAMLHGQQIGEFQNLRELNGRMVVDLFIYPDCVEWVKKACPHDNRIALPLIDHPLVSKDGGCRCDCRTKECFVIRKVDSRCTKLELDRSNIIYRTAGPVPGTFPIGKDSSEHESK